MVFVDLLKIVVGSFLSSTMQGQATKGRVVEGGGGTAWPLTTPPITWHAAHGCGALGSEVEPKEAVPHCGWVEAGHRVGSTCSPWPGRSHLP